MRNDLLIHETYESRMKSLVVGYDEDVAGKGSFDYSFHRNVYLLKSHRHNSQLKCDVLSRSEFL